MKIAGLLCLTLLGSVVPSIAFAQDSPTFRESFYVAPVDLEEREVRSMLETCVVRFRGPLTSSGLFIERNSPEVASVVSECVEGVGSSTFARDCDLVSAQVQVDLVFMLGAVDVGDDWLMTAHAMSPALAGSIWSDSELIDGDDPVGSALTVCNEVATRFLATRDPAYAVPVVVSERVPVEVVAPEEATVALGGSATADSPDLTGRYHYGEEGADSYEESVRLNRIACDGGVARGCLAMGYAYSDGMVLQADIREAARYWGQACDGGNHEACEVLAATDAMCRDGDDGRYCY